jgi:hypothetical protein
MLKHKFKQRPAISNELKERLIREAGSKCANPGCPNRRTHFHHIKDWAVYETHDARDMIAVCPSCHDAIHHGTLSISDQVLYRWKKLARPDGTVRDHLYVEPGRPVKLLLGSIAVSCQQEAIVFELSSHNRLKFRILGGDILLLDLRVSSLSGREVLWVVDNHIRHESDPAIAYEQVPGHLRVRAPATPEYIPIWGLQKMRIREPTYASDNLVTLLELEVLEPGLVSVQGLWAEDARCVLITRKHLSFIRPSLREPLSIAGEGKDTVLHWTGPINSALFGF